MKRLGQKLNDLLGDARSLLGRRRGRHGPRGVAMQSCQGLDTEANFDLIDAALPPGSEEVVKEICDHIMAIDALPPRPLGGGKETKDFHDFLGWVQDLRDGWCQLPDRIPLTVLKAWRDG